MMTAKRSIVLLCLVGGILPICSGCFRKDANSDQRGLARSKTPPPIEIEFAIPTPEGRPILRIKPYKTSLEKSELAFGQYSLLVRRDGKPFYQRLIDPEEISLGSIKDLALPGDTEGHDWSVALERVIDNQLFQQVSNSIPFDPRNTSALAVPSPISEREIVFRIVDEGIWIDDFMTEFPTRPTKLETALGQPSRMVANHLIWDELGIFVLVENNQATNIQINFAEPLAASALFPRNRFAGNVQWQGTKFSRDSTPEHCLALDMRSFRPGVWRSGPLFIQFLANGTLENISIYAD